MRGPGSSTVDGRLFGVTGAILAGLVALSACGGGAPPTPPSAAVAGMPPGVTVTTSGSPATPSPQPAPAQQSNLPNYVPHGAATAGAAPTMPAAGASRATLSVTTPGAVVTLPSRSTTTEVTRGSSPFAVDLDALSPDAAAHALRLLHVQWFIGAATGSLDHGATQVQVAPADPTQLAALARQYPGRVWSLGQEPNGITASYPPSQPAAYAARLHTVATTLHAADPTARLLGPDVLDWNTACTGCGGMQSGQAWTEAMRRAYLAAYGQEVPFDIWSIHTYPLDWQHLPTVNYPEMEAQLVNLRQWLNAIPALRDKPIWDTELGVHWGYTAYQFAPVNGKATLLPAGVLRSDLVEEYLRQFLTWLVANGQRYRIARWFVWAAYNPDVPGDHAGAISLLDGPGPDARLTPFGRIFLAAQQRSPATDEV